MAVMMQAPGREGERCEGVGDDRKEIIEQYTHTHTHTLTHTQFTLAICRFTIYSASTSSEGTFTITDCEGASGDCSDGAGVSGEDDDWCVPCSGLMKT